MRKLKLYFATVLLAVIAALSCPTGKTVCADATGGEYYIGGMTAGFTLSQGGAEVIGLNEVVSDDGIHRPAEEAGIRTGDCIVAIDGIRIKSINELNAALERSAGKQIRVTVRRGGDTAETNVTPAKDKKSGRYKIGVLIRDTLSGIGTVTYIEKNTLRFGALGHGVSDDEKSGLTVADPKVYLCSIVGINKGSRGKAGELRGLFLNDKPLASADCVCETGLYGNVNTNYDFSRTEIVHTASISETTVGKAFIYSTIDGICPQKYEISIVKVDAGQRDNKNFVIKVNDERLIAETGGIVQGMSGSPIIQNGKLIGAVTHVFLNDPTRGYGIGIENMLKN